MSMSIPEPGRTSRLNMRISPDALNVIKSAAERQQQDVSAFVLGAAMERARAILLEDQVLQLSPQAVLQLEKALEAEPVAVPQLADLIRSLRNGSAAARTAEPSALAETQALV
ncbi:MAG TPA: DUF1778 domain-containing protein [Microbacteriaceae bacterium]